MHCQSPVVPLKQLNQHLESNAFTSHEEGSGLQEPPQFIHDNTRIETSSNDELGGHMRMA